MVHNDIVRFWVSQPNIHNDFHTLWNSMVIKPLEQIRKQIELEDQINKIDKNPEIKLVSNIDLINSLKIKLWNPATHLNLGFHLKGKNVLDFH